MTWTKSQLEEEWRHVYETRIGILCGGAAPTEEQQKLAKDEADRHCATLRNQPLTSR